ncbi:HNH endonuclease signature motif containing protein [Chelativorans sp. YIM 93263]|uniref:HNH endonuclease signature motif containing protein n=1 Tax=Chelativorans sp. YIM 93263 TaxID=2906648 RepID=UPI002378F50F|nr:HNH endonuclease [Chelativorans sp. YIM 93263]
MVDVARLLRYGVSSSLADEAQSRGIGVTQIRALSRKVLVDRYGFDAATAAELKKCVQRQPIHGEVLNLLLDRSNHVCCVCKGTKGAGVIAHHIKEYERSKDNSYDNLAVLCPSDHDRAHSKGLTLGLSPQQIFKAKGDWERTVEQENARRAAQAVDVDDDGIDYINIKRIEDMCLNRYGAIPTTTMGTQLVRSGILSSNFTFDERYVRENLSDGYLFGYINSSETEHYRQLLTRLSESVSFEDLDSAARSGIRRLQSLEGKYTFFIGAVTSRHPGEPTTHSAPLTWRHKTSKAEICWDGDAKYLMSLSALGRQGRTNRYLIYGLVRTVLKTGPGKVEVTCSPLLVAQPKSYIDRTPAIAWQRHLDG